MRKYITGNEWKAFFNAITGSRTEIRDKAMFDMAYKHGFRVSELNSIRLSDLDMESRIIYVRRLKNGFSTTHPIQNETYKLVSFWLEKRNKHIKDNDVNPWLFLSLVGHRLSRQWIYKLSRRYGYKAGLTIRMHPHILRHACGYALADQGLDTRLIQDYLGHRNIHHTVLYTASNAARFNQVWKLGTIE